MNQYMIEIWESDNWASRSYIDFSSDKDAEQHCQKVADRTGFRVSADQKNYLGGRWVTVAFCEPAKQKETRGFLPCLGVVATCLSNEDHHGVVCDKCGACCVCCEC